MFEPDKAGLTALPTTEPTSAIEVLQRLRNSYRGSPECSVFSGVDRSVLNAVEMTLHHLARAS